MVDLEGAIAAAKVMAQEATEAGWSMTCVEGEAVFYMPYERALVPGHIYSEAGMDEMRITKCCEYHFDRFFEPGWTDPVTGEFGHMPAEEDD